MSRIYRGGVPAPPKDIARAMGEAGKTGDNARLGQLHAQYLAWLNENGYPQPALGKPAQSDKAAQ